MVAQRRKETEMNYTATIEIPQDKLMMWNDFLKRSDIDYSKEKFAQYETAARWTARFPNGFEADLRVNTNGIEDKDLYAEMVLFDGDGRELSFTDPQYELDGACWYFHIDGDEYRVDVFSA